MRLLLVAVLLWPTLGFAQVLTGTTVWSGEVVLKETIRIEQGAALIIEPGAQVSFQGGGLEVAGRLKASQVAFFGKDWPGIVLKGCSAETVLAGVSVSGAKIGIQVVGGAPMIENSRFTDNRVAVELRQKTTATVRGNSFAGNEKVGLFVKDGTTARITGNRFEHHKQYAAYIYRATPQQFSNNVFEQNATGLMISFAGSEPELRGNRFAENGVGIRVERAARPKIVGNRIANNRIGIDLYRRADPEIYDNQIEDNDQGVSIAYSSYPLIARNNFQSNRVALYLEYQSSTWEGQQGGVERATETVRRSAFGGQNMTVAETLPPRYLDGTVHAQQNWWGGVGTEQLKLIGPQGNPDFVDDGRDRPTFVDAGKTYPLDRVDFSSWQTQPFVFAEGVP